MDGVAAALPAPRALRWHLPAHALMLAVMLASMAAGGGLSHLAGGLALAAAAVGLAVVVRRRPGLRPVLHSILLDLGVMTLVLVALAMGRGQDVSAHAHGIDALVVAAVALAVWAVARIAVTRDRIAVATGVLCAAQLVVMLVV